MSRSGASTRRGQAARSAAASPTGRRLRPVAPAAAAPPLPAAIAGHERRFWFCLYLPDLPLDALAGTPEQSPAAGPPRAVIDEVRGRDWIVAADAAALRAGVKPGLSVSAALALRPGLQLQVRNQAREQAFRCRLAEQAACFTPCVSLEFPEALLLEVRGSLRLFGGHERLARRLQRGFRRQRVVLAGAPTARGAYWLARAGQRRLVSDPRDLPGALGTLPVTVPGWSEQILELLARSGLRTLGDCLRMPRQGFARRFGPDALRDLDQACVRLPEVCGWYEPPERFRADLALDEECADHERLLGAMAPLFVQLRERLQVGQAGLRTLWCRLNHVRLPGEDSPGSTWLRVTLRQASGDFGLLTRLLRMRLEATPLSAPVVGAGILADIEAAEVPAGRDLWGQPLRPDAPLGELLERLRARLGDEAVHGLAVVDEYRPEHAWRAIPPLAGARSARTARHARGIPGPRPLWLLRRPRPLGRGGSSVRGEKGGAFLCLEDGPERIETGWWDGGDIRRDYYRARSRRGVPVWVFQDLRTGMWFLHGIFA